MKYVFYHQALLLLYIHYRNYYNNLPGSSSGFFRNHTVQLWRYFWRCSMEQQCHSLELHIMSLPFLFLESLTKVRRNFYSRIPTSMYVILFYFQKKRTLGSVMQNLLKETKNQPGHFD